MKANTIELGSVLDFLNGKSPPSDGGGEFPVYGSNGRIGSAKTTNHETAIILGRVGAYCGSVEFCDDKFWASDNTIVAKTKDGYDLKYMYYRLKSFPLRSYAGGAAQPLLTHTILRGVKVPVVKDYSQQTRNASVISAYDDLIENNRRRIQLLEEAARLLYKEWFVHLRFPGHEHTKITNGVPEGWEKKYVPDVIDINPGEKVPKNKAIRYIPMAALSTTGMTVELSAIEEREKSTSVRFRNDDVLLARITPCLENGKTALVNFLEPDEIACGSTEFIVLRGRKVSPYFTYCLARAHHFRETAIKSMIGSSGRQRVQPACFDEFVVPLPRPALRDQFDAAVDPIFQEIRVLIRQSRQLTDARDLLLPRLMAGEVVV